MKVILIVLYVLVGTSLLLFVSAGCKKERSVSKKSLYAEGRWIKDSQGRGVILRGINTGGDSKIPPFEPFSTEASAEQIKSWGMNVVRYVTVWEGIEPEKGVYNDAYLDRMEEIVNWLTSRGIYVFIDMHQDLFSRKFCGDGSPEWAVVETSMEYKCGQNWFTYYFTEPVTKSFTNFWTSEELQSHFIGAITRIAERFKDNDLVFGYEIFNEPWHGDFDYMSGEFETLYLAPFYRKVIKELRDADPGAVVLFEPAVLAGGIFMTQSKLPPLGERNLLYAPHYYPLGALLGSEPDIDKAVQEIESDLTAVLEKADELGTPAILGEFGAHPSQPDGEKLIRGYYEKLDKYMMGGTIWTYAPRDMEWNQEGMSLVDAELKERPYVNVVIRPYPRAIAGDPVEFGFDPNSKRFYLEYMETGVTPPTVIYIPGRIYSTDFKVQLSDGTYEYDSSKGELYFYHDPAVKNHRVDISE